MKEYTEKIHRKRVVKMLQRKDPCGCCPAAYRFSDNLRVDEMWDNLPCKICQGFVGYYKPVTWYDGIRCPCHKYGKKEAIKRTIAALKKKGDL